MKRKAIALLLALVMCLALLSACGGDSTTDTSEPPSSESTAQPTQEPGQEGPTGTDPTETEPAETEQPTETPGPENNAGTEFLTLLREEWNNGFIEGEGPKRTYYWDKSWNQAAFISDGVVYIYDVRGYGVNSFYSYDIVTKEFKESVSISEDSNGYSIGVYSFFYVNGNFYFPISLTGNFGAGVKEMRVYDYNTGELLNSLQYDRQYDYNYFFFEKGILVIESEAYHPRNPSVILSHGLEKIADIPAPQREVEHGLKEDVEINAGQLFAADGTVYTIGQHKGSSYLYRLNTDTYEWEEVGDAPNLTINTDFCGKYISCRDGIYDRVTGEQVFEYGELYPAGGEWNHPFLCYFGGDKYLGKKNNEYRWVNLTDMSMSDPLPFPDVHESSLTVLDDTYCVYHDQYGWFLRNYNTGEEETIMLFDN